MTDDEVREAVDEIRSCLIAIDRRVEELKPVADARPELALHVLLPILEPDPSAWRAPAMPMSKCGVSSAIRWCEMPGRVSPNDLKVLRHLAGQGPQGQLGDSSEYYDMRTMVLLGYGDHADDHLLGLRLVARRRHPNPVNGPDSIEILPAGRAYLDLLEGKSASSTSTPEPPTWRLTSDNAIYGPSVSALMSWLLRLVGGAQVAERVAAGPDSTDRFGKLEID